MKGRLVRQGYSGDDVSYVFERNVFGKVAAATVSPRNAVHQYSYDASGRLVSATSADGVIQRTQHDAWDRVVETYSVDGTAKVQRTALRYDAAGNLIERTSALGGIETFTYDEADRLRRAAVEGGGAIEIAYVDAMGSPDEYSRHVRMTEGNDAVHQLVRDPYQRVLEAHDPMGTILRYDYGSRGEVLRLERFAASNPASAYVEHRRYLKNGRLAEVEFPNAEVERFAYDGSGNLTHHTDEAGLVTSYEYASPFRLPTRVWRPATGWSETTYDPLERVTAVVHHSGSPFTRTDVTRYDDELGRIAHTPAGLGEVSTTLSGDGRVLEERDPGLAGAMRVFNYDAAGRLQFVTDAAGHVTEYQLDAAGNLLGTLIDGIANGSQTSYDALGRVDWTQDANGTTDYRYRATDGRLGEIVFADGTRRALSYHGNGLVASLSNHAADDALESVRNFSYDHQGLLSRVAETRADGSQKSVEFRRDLRGRVRAEIVDGDAANANDADYYANGTLKRLNTLHYDRDGVTGLVTSVRRAPRSGDFASYGVLPAAPDSGYEAFDVRYNADGLPVSLGMASGLALGREYDVATGLLRAVTTPSRTHSYEYGVDGQLGRVVTSVGETVIDEVAYTYANRRLTGFARSGHSTETYDYDGAGNLTLVRDAASQAVLEARTHDTSNQLVTNTTVDGTEAFAYDARGRLTARARSGAPSTTYRYDGLDQLEGVSTGNLPRQLFGYDALGRLSRDEELGGRTRTLGHFGTEPVWWDEASVRHTVAPSDAWNAPLFAQQGGATDAAMWQGHELREVYGEDGALREEAMRSPYGKLLSGTSERLPFGFKGYYGHLGGELHRAFARTYDAGLGAFTSWDALAGDAYEPITMNRLRAFSGNPVGVDDWLGLEDYGGLSVSAAVGQMAADGAIEGDGGYANNIDWDVTRKKAAEGWRWLFYESADGLSSVGCWLFGCGGPPSDFGALDLLGDGAGKLRLPDLGQGFSSNELLRWPGEPEPRLLAFNITGEDDLNAEQLNNLTRGIDILRRMAVNDSPEAQRARDLFGAWGHDLEVLTTPGLGPRLEVGGYEWLPETLRPAGAWVPFTGHKIVMPGYSLFNTPTSAAEILMHELSHWGAINSQHATPWHLFQNELERSRRLHRRDYLLGGPEGGIGESLFGDWWTNVGTREKPR